MNNKDKRQVKKIIFEYFFYLTFVFIIHIKDKRQVKKIIFEYFELIEEEWNRIQRRR